MDANPSFVLYEAKAKHLSDAGYKLALWEEGQEWYWAWKNKQEAIVSTGSTTGATKAFALVTALEQI